MAGLNALISFVAEVRLELGGIHFTTVRFLPGERVTILPPSTAKCLKTEDHGFPKIALICQETFRLLVVEAVSEIPTQVATFGLERWPGLCEVTVNERCTTSMHFEVDIWKERRIRGY